MSSCDYCGQAISPDPTDSEDWVHTLSNDAQCIVDGVKLDAYAKPAVRWWENLDDNQTFRLGELIGSCCRLLGENYARAYDACTVDVSDENKKWVLG